MDTPNTKICRTLESFTITQGYPGTYSTRNPINDNSYSYYLNGDTSLDSPHFTVQPTGGGNGRITNFHISVTDGNANGRVFYNYHAPGNRIHGTNDITRSNNSPDFTGVRPDKVAGLNARIDLPKFDAMAAEFWRLVQR